MLLLSLLLPSIIQYVNYIGWYEVEIPTSTHLKGRIKLPNGWEFVMVDGIITIIDKTTNELVAKEIVQGENLIVTDSNGTIITNNLDTSLPLTVENISTFYFIKGYSNSVYLYNYDDLITTKICINLEICDKRDYGGYWLLMAFEDDVELEIIEKIINSYCWGGYIE